MLTVEDCLCATCREGIAEDTEAECFECLSKAATANYFEHGSWHEVFNRDGKIVGIVQRDEDSVSVELNYGFLNPDRLQLDPQMFWWVRFHGVAADNAVASCQEARYSTNLWPNPDADLSDATFGVGWDVVERMNQYLARVARECVAVAYGSSLVAAEEKGKNAT